MYARPFLLCSVLIAGQGAAAQTLVGEWNCSMNDPAFLMQVGISYADNGQVERSVLLNDTLEGKDIAIDLTAKGAWTVDGQTLNETIRRVKINQIDLDGVDVTRDPQFAGLKADVATLVGEQTGPIKVSFRGDEMFFTDAPAGGMTCMRVEIIDD